MSKPALPRRSISPSADGISVCEYHMQFENGATFCRADITISGPSEPWAPIHLSTLKVEVATPGRVAAVDADSIYDRYFTPLLERSITAMSWDAAVTACLIGRADTYMVRWGGDCVPVLAEYHYRAGKRTGAREVLTWAPVQGDGMTEIGISGQECWAACAPYLVRSVIDRLVEAARSRYHEQKEKR